jgi:branched-chain amino acid transport system substrate-binding protein
MGATRLRVIGIAVVCVVGLAACGSSSKSGSTSSAASSAGAASSTTAASPAGAASSTTGPSADKAPYVLGVAAATSGPISTSVGPIGPTLQAWGKWTNAHGGIDGHPVKVVSMDDGGNPANGLSDVKQMVQQDHIIAMVPGDGLETVYAPYLKSENIPVIGGTDAASTYSTYSNWFSLTASPDADNYDALAAGKQIAGIDKIGVMYCAEVAACSAVVGQVKQLEGSLGIKVVSSSAISSSATDYTAPCLAARSAGANGLFISAATQQHVDVSTSCARQGYKVPQVANDEGFSALWLKSPAVDGSVLTSPSFPFIDDSNAATKAFQHAVTQYLPSARSSQSWGPTYSSAWLSGEIFAKAAELGNLGNNPSPGGVLKGLYSFHNETLGGLTAPLNYVRGDNPNVKNNCAYVLEIKAGKFAEPQGLKPVCKPA